MKHKFTFRETVLILICAVLALGIFYYEFAYKNIENDIASHSTEELTDQLTIAQSKAVKYKQMQDAIASSTNTDSQIAVYNNLAGEVSELGSILNGRASDIAIIWNDPTLTDTTVRRQANVSFDTSSYGSAKSLVQQIIDCRWRNVVTDLDISSNTDDSLRISDDVSVTLTVTFFETSEGAENTKGLVSQDDNSSAS